VPKVPPTGEHHRHSEPVCRGDHVGVTDRSARLCDRRDARSGEQLDAVREREERVAARRAAGRVEPGGARLLDRDPARVDPAGLAGADPNDDTL